MSVRSRDAVNHTEQASQGKSDRRHRRKFGLRKNNDSVVTVVFVVGIFVLFLGGGLVVLAMKIVEMF